MYAKRAARSAISARIRGEEGSYTLSGQEMIDYVEQHIHPGVREFHIVGGHNNHVPFQYYVDSLKALNEKYPNVTLKAYTAAEIDFFHTH